MSKLFIDKDFMMKEFGRLNLEKDIQLTDEQIDALNELQGKGRIFLCYICEHVPPSADRSAAIRSFRTAIWQANQAIIHDWPSESGS